MEKETRNIRRLIHESDIALSRLDSVKAVLSHEEEIPEAPKDYLHDAIGNLHFVNKYISALVADFFAEAKSTLVFRYRTSSFLGEIPIMYNAGDHKNKLAYAFDPMKKPGELTEDILKRLWNANINQDAVKVFGKLSKEELIGKFQSHIVSSIK